MQPRNGTRLNPVDEDGNPITAKTDEKEAKQTEAEDSAKGDNEQKGDRRKNEVTKLLPENNITSFVNSLVATSAMKNISTKAKEELEKQKKKAINIKLVCCSLLLCYNKIRELHNFESVVAFVMPDYKNLQWVDLSHNYLEKLDYSFEGFPQLRTLYLHCNYLTDLNDFAQLSSHQQLKTLMIHGNPLTAVPNFRCFLISVLPNLKKIDSVLVSRKEVDNATFLRTQIKKFPLPKNPAKPPIEKSE